MEELACLPVASVRENAALPRDPEFFKSMVYSALQGRTCDLMCETLGSRAPVPCLVWMTAVKSPFPASGFNLLQTVFCGLAAARTLFFFFFLITVTSYCKNGKAHLAPSLRSVFCGHRVGGLFPHSASHQAEILVSAG